MNVRIDSVSVNGLGPISSIQWSFKDINLIYGKNEQGKTFLVEYLLRSLFKNAPATRDLTDSGQVILSGIGGSPSQFNPRTKDKIDALILAPGSKAFDLSRLCVVRGGDLSLTWKAGETVTKAVLKDYLSDQQMLDKILERVPGAVRESALADGVIVPGRQVGLVKSWNSARQEIDRIDQLLRAVDAEYSQGAIQMAGVKLKEVKTEIDRHLRAKRIHAFHVAAESRDVETKLDLLPETALDAARSSVEKVRELRAQIENLKKQASGLLPKAEDYVWLKTAVEECEKRPEALRKTNSLALMIPFVVALAGAVAGAFISPYIAMISGLVAAVFAYLVWKQYQLNEQSSGDRQEVAKIYSDFESRFGRKAVSIASLKSAIEPLQNAYYQMNGCFTQTKEKEQELELAEVEKNRHLTAFVEYQTNEVEADGILEEARKKRQELLGKKSDLKAELARINLEPEEYLDEETDVKYDFAQLRKLEVESKRLDELITSENMKLQNLKQRICDLTRDKVTDNWDVLFDHLRLKQESAVEECKMNYAKIVGGILVKDTINDLRKLEDENIYDALRSKSFSGPINALIPSYSGVTLEGEDLVVFNDGQRFSLSTMSTGAKEQVLLALRIGLTSHLMGDHKMFLILDDAFQHSDWSRREILVREISALAHSGWQIIYFTMDDHIKQLFEKQVQPVFQERYQSFLL